MVVSAWSWRRYRETEQAVSEARSNSLDPTGERSFLLMMFRGEVEHGRGEIGCDRGNTPSYLNSRFRRIVCHYGFWDYDARTSKEMRDQ